MLARFPEYRALKNKAAGGAARLSEQELREIKFWFILAYFDPDFLERPVTLTGGEVVDLTDIISRHHDGAYLLRKRVDEGDCARIIAETWKVLSNIVPVHRKLLYDPDSQKGQIDVITTPFYHPILPLVADTDAARDCQPADPMPPRFRHPEDAEMQIAKASAYFRKTFGRDPFGMWPAEGSVSEESVALFQKQGIRWIATDEKILERSSPSGLSRLEPYSAGRDARVALVFRDTGLSDRIGFTYQSWYGRDAAYDFVNAVAANRPRDGEPDRLLTVILDGENAWEWYVFDNDGREFLRTMYGRLTELGAERSVVTTTMTEYIGGNASRGIPPHPVASMKKIDRLYPGSWINANFDTWIGHPDKNRAWEYLRTARADLGASGVPRPDPHGSAPEQDSPAWFAWKAWEEMYAAEGSDWFWWYGTRQNVPGGIRPFDEAFRLHLGNIYTFARRAGYKMPERVFAAIGPGEDRDGDTVQGAMKQGAATQ